MNPDQAPRRRVPTPVRAVVFLLVLALVVVACGPADPTPSPTPGATPAVTPETTPGATASPGDDPDAAMYEQIEAEVEELRGLQALRAVARGVMDEAALQAFVEASFHEDNPDAEVEAFERLLQRLRLMPQDESLEALYLELLTSQVAGLYDPADEKMYVVSRTGEIGPLEKVTYAHEYVHALQDQHFDLEAFIGEERDQGDRTLARTSLVEGDATLLMFLWAQQALSAQELAEVGASADPASEEILARMPTILRETLLFPYTAGWSFTMRYYLQGGFDAVDAMFESPPVSTEQILHPEKYDAGELPVAVTFPGDLTARLGSGWTSTLEDTLGEFQLAIWLRDAAGVGEAASAQAAAGWGGDRLVMLEGPDGAWAVVLDTAWDDDTEAEAFAAAAAPSIAGYRGAGSAADLLRPAGDRVVILVTSSTDVLGRVANALGLAG
jgi:hypothetical protein